MIDVRAPVEFLAASLPGAVNLPLLTDDERARVGTIYKEEGNEAAVKLGHELVSGPVKEARVAAWLEFLRREPEAVFCCFRGGLRSQISRRWAAEAGVDRPLVRGGYKAARAFLLERTEEIVKGVSLLSVAGPTGSGKSLLIERTSAPKVHLERIARHRGSAFGKMKAPQPPQATFENDLAAHLLRVEAAALAADRLVVEDESRLVGRCHLPDVLFHRMMAAPVVWVEEPLAARVENIFREYVEEAVRPGESGVFREFTCAVNLIRRKLGGALAEEILGSLALAEAQFLRNGALDGNRGWIEKLLVQYYDPLYRYGTEKRRPRIAFRGTGAECLAFLNDGRSSGFSR